MTHGADRMSTVRKPARRTSPDAGSIPAGSTNVERQFVEVLADLKKKQAVFAGLLAVFGMTLPPEHPLNWHRRTTHTHVLAPCNVCGEQTWIAAKDAGKKKCRMTPRCPGKHLDPRKGTQ